MKSLTSQQEAERSEQPYREPKKPEVHAANPHEEKLDLPML